MSRKRLGEILLEAGLIKKRQLEHALLEQQRWGGPLGKILIGEGFVSEELLTRALGKQLNIPIISLKEVTVAQSVLDTVDVEFAEQHGVIPFQLQSKFLDVAMTDPMNMGVIDELRIRSQLNVRPHLAAPTEIQEAIARSYRGETQQMGIDVDFGDPGAGRIRHHRDDKLADMREAEIAALQRRLAATEALVKRNEDVIRKLLGLLVTKGVATREETLKAIK